MPEKYASEGAMRWSCTLVVVLAVTAPVARADLIFENGTANTFAGTEPGRIIVRDSPTSPPLATSLVVAPSGSIAGGLFVYGGSSATVQGGTMLLLETHG